MTESARDNLTKILTPETLELIDKAILDMLKAPDRGQIVIETKQYSVRSVFAGHYLLVSKTNGDHLPVESL